MNSHRTWILCSTEITGNSMVHILLEVFLIMPGNGCLHSIFKWSIIILGSYLLPLQPSSAPSLPLLLVSLSPQILPLGFMFPTLSFTPLYCIFLIIIILFPYLTVPSTAFVCQAISDSPPKHTPFKSCLKVLFPFLPKPRRLVPGWETLFCEADICYL